MDKLIGVGRSLWNFSILGEAVILDDDCVLPVAECANKIIITHIPSPDIVIYMQNAIAIIAETGGVLCHAAVLALEMGCPIIVGAEGIKKMIKTGDTIWATANSGEGKIYERTL